MFKKFIVSVFLLNIFVGYIYALEDKDLELTGDFSYNSAFVWRGQVLDKNNMFQTGIYAKTHNIGLFVRTNNEATSNYTRTWSSNKVDYEINYTYNFSKVAAVAGYDYYAFPSGDPSRIIYAREIYIKAIMEMLVTPTITLIKDFSKEDVIGYDNGTCLIVSGTYSFDIGIPYTLDTRAEIGYLNKYYVQDYGMYIDVGASVDIPLKDRVTLTPSLSLMVPYADLDDNNNAKFYGGIKLSYKM
jgi:hypothetical protein